MYILVDFVIRFFKTEKVLCTIDDYRDNTCSNKNCVIFLLKILIKILKQNFNDTTYMNFELFLTSEKKFKNIYSPSGEHI